MCKNVFISKCCFPESSIYFFAAFFILSSFSNCRPTGVEDELIREWYVINCTTPLTKLGGKGPVSVFRFYSGNKFSAFGGFAATFGTWRFNTVDTSLYLHPVTGDEILDCYYHIDFMNNSNMQMTLFRDNRKQRGTDELTFTLQKGPRSSFAEDPYKLELHKWRQHPMHLETDQEIRERVLNYLEFLKTLYRHAIRHQFKSFLSDWFPQSFRVIHGNEVRMAYPDELNGWYDCFYDSAQAVKGYQIISDPIKRIVSKNNVSIFERNLDCVKQLIQAIK